MTVEVGLPHKSYSMHFSCKSCKCCALQHFVLPTCGEHQFSHNLWGIVQKLNLAIYSRFECLKHWFHLFKVNVTSHFKLLCGLQQQVFCSFVQQYGAQN